jgi:acyl dehydratase
MSLTSPASGDPKKIAVGDELPAQDFGIGRADLVRYAGASGDFNPIHWNERFATSVGLPDVIAHGMFTMASAIRVVTDWAGDPAAVVEYGVRFTRPVIVPDPGGTRLHVAGTVRAVREDGLVEIDLTCTVEGRTVLARARALVRLP